MSKLSWFKHYNTAHEGQSICTLWAEGKGELVGFYWTLLELVSRWEEPGFRGSLKVSLRVLCRKFHQTSRKLRRNLVETSQNFGVSITEVSPEFFEIIVPNWLELQESRGGKRESKFEQSSSKHGVEERSKKGEERIKSKETEVTKVRKPRKPRPPASAPHEQTLGAKIFESYAEAYRERWKTKPVRNTSVNAIAKRIGEALGEAGIDVARFYVFHNKAYYVQNCHPIKLLLSDHASLHTQWITNRQVTSTEAKAVETKQNSLNVFDRVLAKREERENEHT